MKKSAQQNVSNKKIKVCCNETGQVFNSLTEASEWCGISVSNISVFLSGTKGKLSAGKHPITKQKLTWSYRK